MHKGAEKIFLIGYRATGKSSVARELASLLGWTAIDMDDAIEERAGVVIADIVAAGGWERFRNMERGLLQEILEGPGRCVVACGGGVVLHRDLMEEASSRFLVVWLTAPVDVIRQRIGSDTRTASGRPSLSGQPAEDEVARVLSDREPLYRRFSRIQIDTSGIPPAGVAREIMEALKHAG